MRCAIRNGFLPIVLLLAAIGPARAAGENFAGFLSTARSYCATAPAPACIDRLWPLADRDRDGVLNLGEVQALEQDAAAWAQTADRKRRDPERDTTLIVLMVLQQAGLPKAFEGFDTDRDGALSCAELFADFKLDKRPFAKIAADPAAVDWATLGNRFGPIGELLSSLMRSQGQPARPGR